MMSPGVESASNNLGIEARIANAVELPQITFRETWKRVTFSIILSLFNSCPVKDRIILKVFTFVKLRFNLKKYLFLLFNSS